MQACGDRKGNDGQGEYEKAGLALSFDIQQTGNIQEIGINALTGKVVENESEGLVDHD